MMEQLASDEFRICRRDRLVDFTLGHPVDAHGLARGTERAISAARNLHKILPFIRLAKVRFATVESMNFRMFLELVLENRTGC
jgi:histidyl-tRNA synthetase